MTADAIRNRQTQDGYLRGRYGPGWQSEVNWSCLTGNAQMALIWLKFYELTNDIGYFQAATRANQYLKQVQSRISGSMGIQGGIAGSFPIYGGYAPYEYLNWATKFFADSLMLEERLKNRNG